MKLTRRLIFLIAVILTLSLSFTSCDMLQSFIGGSSNTDNENGDSGSNTDRPSGNIKPGGDDNTGNEGGDDPDTFSTRLAVLSVDGTQMYLSPDKYDYIVYKDINKGYSDITVLPNDPDSKVDMVKTLDTGKTLVFTITVTTKDGVVGTPYTLTLDFITELEMSKNVIVNKGGADATVSFIIDDGDHETAVFAAEMLDKYENLSLSFGLLVNKLASLKMQTVDGQSRYVMDENGNYEYTVNQNEVDFWRDILSNANGRAEITNHSYSHSYWGQNDDGGEQTYANGNSVSTVNVPVGSSSKELYASNQIIRDLFPEYAGMGNGTFINAGIGVPMTSTTINGVTYPSYYEFFYEYVILRAYRDNEILGMRQTSGSRVVTYDKFATEAERLNIPGLMIVNGNNDNSGVGLKGWTNYIDMAINQNGWAAYCIHKMTDTNTTGHYITTPNAEALFKYAHDRNVWIATVNDATRYYREWSTAELATEFTDGVISVSITDNENDSLCNIALTAKVYIPAMWESAYANGEALEIHKDPAGTYFVYVDVVPDTGAVEVTNSL